MSSSIRLHYLRPARPQRRFNMADLSATDMVFGVTSAYCKVCGVSLPRLNADGV